MQTDRRTAPVDPDALRLIFDRLHEKVLKRAEDEKHASDRHQRRAVDALRSRIKRLDPPVRVTNTWNDIKPRVEKYAEYDAIETDELRESAFEKVLKRIKEKDEDAEKERDRRRSRRDDDRDYRNGHRDTRHPRTSRTPEADAYEADRRRAMAEREKQYRKGGSLGLTPPPDSIRDRDRRRDRDDRHGRLIDRSPPLRLSHYDRERRDREEERERLYRTRGDPRGNRDELNYGEDGPRSIAGSERRRRRGDSDAGSEASGVRSSKRSRKRSKTPEKESKKEAPEPAGVHSGSEEGEIEED